MSGLHNTTGPAYDCWCGPQVLAVCPECDDPGLPEYRIIGPDGQEHVGRSHRLDCWRCGGRGLVPCDDPEHYDGPHGLLVVHRCDACKVHPCACEAKR